MTMMISEIYEALKEAGASEAKAKAAAEAIAGYENRFNRPRNGAIRGRLERDLTVLKWMVGFNLAVSAAVLIKLLM